MFTKLLVTAALMLPISASAADYSTTRQYVYPVVILKESSDKIVTSGSGVVIQSGYVLTAAHLVPNSKQPVFVNNNGLRKASIIKVDDDLDLALLAVDVKCPCALLSANLAVDIDQPVYAVAFPFYLDYKVQVVTIGQMQGVYQNTLITTTNSGPGSSGGGLFAKEKGTYYLLGIIKGVPVVDVGIPFKAMQQQNWYTLSTSSVAIRNFLIGTPAMKKGS